MKTPDLAELYEDRLRSNRAMSHHMAALREIASLCHTCVEFGIRYGPSTVALLTGCEGVVHSYDVEHITGWHDPIKAAAGDRWVQHYEPSHTAVPFETDLLMHDSYHNYSQVRAEMALWAGHVKRFLVFHDSISCAIHGEGITGGKFDKLQDDKRGIRLAIDELMIRDDSWRIFSHDPLSNGLLVLERR